MKKSFLFASLIAAVLVLPIAAQAQSVYVGANVGQTELKASDSSGWSAKDNDTGAKIYVGTDLSKNFGLEAGYAGLGEYGDSTASVKVRSFYVAGTATYPINNQFGVFAKVGASGNQIKLNTGEKYNRTTALVGVGASYSFSQNVSVVAEYENYGKVFNEGGNTVKADVVSVGVRYKF
jgi:OOP family OmpA-OmpF porin